MKPLIFRIALSLILLGMWFSFIGKSHAQIIGNPTAMAQSTTGESSHIFKSAAGSLYALGVTSSAAGYAMLFNTTTAPSNGTVAPVACYAIGANSTLWLQYSLPFPFGTGITAVYSTTGCFNLTLSSAYFAAQVR